MSMHSRIQRRSHRARPHDVVPITPAQAAGAAFDPNLLYQLKVDNTGDGSRTRFPDHLRWIHAVAAGDGARTGESGRDGDDEHLVTRAPPSRAINANPEESAAPQGLRGLATTRSSLISSSSSRSSTIAVRRRGRGHAADRHGERRSVPRARRWTSSRLQHARHRHRTSDRAADGRRHRQAGLWGAISR